jgi:hypothetical protein
MIRLGNGNALPDCGYTRVYFPVVGICSIVATMGDGTAIEVSSVGNEGVVGLPMLGSKLLPEHRFLQISNGTAHYMPTITFESLCVGTEFGRAVDRFRGFFLKSVIQLGACNSLHPLKARSARWILFAHERIGRAQFEVTETLLMSATGGAAETHLVIDEFRKRQIIKYRQGKLTVLDPIALRRLACSCYGTLTGGLRNHRSAEVEAQPDGIERESSGNIVPMRSAAVCTLCGLGVSAPHKSHSDCLRAIDGEMRLLMSRARQLTKQRAAIAMENMQKFEKFLRRRES